MGCEIGEKVTSRRAEFDRTDRVEHIPVREADAELERDDHGNEEENEFLLG